MRHSDLNLQSLLISVIFLLLLVSVSCQRVQESETYSLTQDSDIDYLFTNEYIKVFSSDFLDCMFSVENGTEEYHTCASFNDDTAMCRCKFLSDVDERCKSLGQADGTYWYLEEELRICLVLENPEEGEIISNSNTSESSVTNIPTHIPNNLIKREYKSRPKFDYRYSYQNKTLYSQTEAHNKLDSSSLFQPKYSNISAINFEQHYNDKIKQPSAMTVDCDFMQALKANGVAGSGLATADQHLLMFNTTMTISGPTSTSTSTLQIMKVLEEGRSRLEKRSSLNNITGNFTKVNQEEENGASSVFSIESSVLIIIGLSALVLV